MISDNEVQKEVLAHDANFVAISAFQRIDLRRRKKIDSMDLVTFFRDNGLVVGDGDCYLIVKQFDSNYTGSLSLLDFMLAICPQTYTYTKNFLRSRRQFNYLDTPSVLSHRMEHAVFQVLQR